MENNILLPSRRVNISAENEQNDDSASLLLNNKTALPTVILSLSSNNNLKLIGKNDKNALDLESFPDPLSKSEKEAEANGSADEIKKVKKVREGWRRYIGIILALTSSMLFPLAGLIVKVLPEYHPYSVTFWRFQGILIPSIPVAIYHRVIQKEMIFDKVLPISAPGHGKTLAILVIRGLAGATAVMLQFYAFQYISMADASVITFCTPVFVTLVAHYTLGESCGLVPILSGVLALVGVGVITRPPLLTGADGFEREVLIGAGLAFGSMILATVTFVVLRHLRELHYSMITLFFGIWGSGETLILGLAASTFQLPVGWIHWLMAGALAALTFVGQMCITLAFKYETAGTVSLCRTCDVIFAFIWQFVFLGVSPDRYSAIGASIVLFGIFLVGLRKWVQELPPDNRTKKQLSFLLR